MTPDTLTAAPAPATATQAALTLQSFQMKALLAIVFLFPVLLAAFVLPSPGSDLREHINLGLAYRFTAFAAPPLQTWLAGAVALTGARDAWLYIAVAQVLNFIGLAYLVLIARRFIGEDAPVPLTIMFCGSIYFSIFSLTMALNADQIQVPLWAGIVFHGMMALRDDRWRDWILCGVLLGVTVLAKYTVLVLLAALALALLLIPEYRKVFRNPKLYAAGLVSLPIIALHAVPEWHEGHAVDYASVQFRSWASLWARIGYFWELIRSYVLYGGLILLGLAGLVWRRQIAIRPIPADPAQRLILLTVTIYLAVIVVLIFGFGFNYATRHTYPLFGLTLLALLIVIRITPLGTRLFANFLLAVWGGVIIGSVVYALVARHGVLQEPGPAAADVLRQAWERRFTCGPAYIIGNDRSARLIAINYGKPVLGLAFDDTTRPDWMDKDRLARLGAIVVTSPEYAVRPPLASWFKGRTLETLTLPYRRTRRTTTHDYVHYFIAPEACPAAVK